MSCVQNHCYSCHAMPCLRDESLYFLFVFCMKLFNWLSKCHACKIIAIVLRTRVQVNWILSMNQNAHVPCHDIYLCCGCLHEVNWLSKCHACEIIAIVLRTRVQVNWILSMNQNAHVPCHDIYLCCGCLHEVNWLSKCHACEIIAIVLRTRVQVNWILSMNQNAHVPCHVMTNHYIYLCCGCLRDECTHHHRLHRGGLVFFKSRHPGGEILKVVF